MSMAEAAMLLVPTAVSSMSGHPAASAADQLTAKTAALPVND